MKKTLRGNKTFGLLILFVIVFVVFTILQPRYASFDNFKTILYNAAISGILMIGFSGLMISGNADMSVAAVGTISAILCSFMINAGMPWYLSVLLAIVFGGLCGYLNSILWYKFRIMPFIGTMGISNVWTGLSGFLTKNAAVAIPESGMWRMGDIVIGFVPITFVYVIVLAIVYGVILSKTKFGRQVYMCGGNVMAARLAGVKVAKIGTIMMINCSALSAFGGVVMLARMHTFTASSMSTTLMSSITAAFLGGISFGGGSGSMLGGCIGLLLLNFFNNGLILIGMDSYWQIFAQGAILILSLIIDRFNSNSKVRANSKLAKAK